MAKINKHIEIVVPANSDHGESSQTPLTTICGILESEYSKVGVTYVSTNRDLDQPSILKSDVALTRSKRISKATENKDETVLAWLSDELGAHSVNHTGSQSEAFTLDMHKHKAKATIKEAGLNTGDSFVSKNSDDLHKQTINITYPLFAKPNSLGTSRGVDDDSVIHDYKALVAKVDSIKNNWGVETIVETYLSGKEFSVAVFSNQAAQETQALSIEVIVAENVNGDRILSREVDTSHTEKVVAVTDNKLRSSLESFALDVFDTLGGRDYGRIDIRLDDSGKPSFIEANFLPGLGFDGYLAQACKINLDMSYREMILLIVEIGLTRDQK